MLIKLPSTEENMGRQTGKREKLVTLARGDLAIKG
jgi:hypothetical protein